MYENHGKGLDKWSRHVGVDDTPGTRDLSTDAVRDLLMITR